VTYVDRNGRRVFTESAYLTPEVLGRPNLTVAIHAHVTKILFDKPAASGQEPCAIGVEFAQNKSGPRYRARAAKEVIVCAGAIHSPHVS
jgi:choline dehydrogenase